jgi:hypothetical protein
VKRQILRFLNYGGDSGKMQGASNHYERAFVSRLRENAIPYIAVDQHERKVFSEHKLKSFDFMFYPSRHRPVIADIKGRRFDGVSLVSGFLQCWVTRQDLAGLKAWKQVFAAAQPVEAVFIFAYDLLQIDVETDGQPVYDFDGRRYIFQAVRLEDYLCHSRPRSRQWDTVTLSAGHFRQLAISLQSFIQQQRQTY